jgi:hypothetical protein
MTTSYLNGFAAPFTLTATPSMPVPHPGCKNIPPHMISPHTPLPTNFLQFSPFQLSLSTPPSLHYAPLPSPSPYPLSMTMSGLLTPAHLYAGCYPPSFLYSNRSQSQPKLLNASGELLASMSPGYGIILC